MVPRDVAPIPRASRPRFSVLGVRPTATSTRSKRRVMSAPLRWQRAECPSSSRAKERASHPVWMAMPRASRRRCTSAEASASSPGKIRAAWVIKVTREPRPAMACASSQPTGPAPSTSRRRGSSRMAQSVSEVRKSTSAKPGISGTLARAPLAITMWRVRMRSPLTSTSQGDTSLASPATQSTPRAVKRSTESCGSMAAIFCCTRRMTCGKFTATSTGARPNPGARRISSAT